MKIPTIEKLIKLNRELPRKLEVSARGYLYASDGKKIDAAPLSPKYVIVDRKYNREATRLKEWGDKVWRPYRYEESSCSDVPLSCGEVRLLLGRDFPWNYTSDSEVETPLEVVSTFCNFNAYLLGGETIGETAQGTTLVPVMLFNIPKERQRSLAIDKKTLKYVIERIEGERQGR